MDNAKTDVAGDKENIVADFRNKIENWRGERYEKLCSRLLRVRESVGNKNHFVSPSILGMKCPKEITERVSHQECSDHRKRKAFSDLQVETRCRKSGLLHRPVRKFPEGPPVRQTLSSKLRVLHSNPLLENNIAKKSGTFDLDKTAIKENAEDSESPEAIFSTPAVGNYHPQFPDSVSEIKPAKPPFKIPLSKTFLRYD